MLPNAIRSWTQSRFGVGAWIKGIELGVVLFDDNKPVHSLVLHELTHGLLYVLTSGFPFPVSLQEGLAMRHEYLLGRSDIRLLDAKKSDSALGDRSRIDSGVLMSIWELLTFDVDRYWKKDISAFKLMTQLSAWLDAYFLWLARNHPNLKRMLGELYRLRLYEPTQIYEWLQREVRASAQELEEGFRRFCTGEGDMNDPWVASYSGAESKT
jgi:hypothetical protein